MQQAMEIGQGMTDWSHATMNRGHFSTPTQGAMQHTPSLAAQIPDPISGPVQVYSSSPSMAPLQVSLRYIPRSSEAPEYGACIYYPIWADVCSAAMSALPLGFQSCSIRISMFKFTIDLDKFLATMRTKLARNLAISILTSMC